MNQRDLETRLEQLKVLRKQGYRYIARSQHDELRAYKNKPEKQINFWYVRGELPHPIASYGYDDVKWYNIEPMNILSEIKSIEKALKV